VTRGARATARVVPLAIAVALALGGCSPRGAGPGPGLRHAQRMIELLNAGDEEAYGRFRDEAFARHDVPEATWREGFRSLRTRFGQLTITEVDSGHTNLRVHLRSERQPDARLQMELEVEPGPSRRILQVGLAVEGGATRGTDSLGIGRPAIRSGMTDRQLALALGSFLDGLAARDLFSGAIRVEIGGRLVYEAARGLASRSYEVANTTATRFRIGSITKSMVRVAVARLIEDGAIDPDAPMRCYLPGYPDPAVASRVTIRHLLEHRSGLAELRFRDMIQRANRLLRRPEDYFPYFATDPLQFAPGSRELYSNAGYIVLGAIVERVTGAPYETSLRRAVFEPAGMKDSGFHALDRVHRGVATGYWKCEGRDGPWCSNEGILEIEGTPSGGSYSTVADLSRFYHALAGGRLLPDRWSHWIFTGAWPGDEPVDRSRWHAGWAGGAEGVSAVLAERGGVLVVVLSNQDEPAGEIVGTAILDALGETEGV